MFNYRFDVIFIPQKVYLDWFWEGMYTLYTPPVATPLEWSIQSAIDSSTSTINACMARLWVVDVEGALSYHDAELCVSSYQQGADHYKDVYSLPGDWNMPSWIVTMWAIILMQGPINHLVGRQYTLHN